LKRSKASSREAIHEVLKYIEGIKENKSLRNDEFFAIVVSTEWDELLIPFSSFVHNTSYTVIGYKLQIDKDNNPISAEIVPPLELHNERFLSDTHGIALYTDSDKLEKGIESHKYCYQDKNITDYVVLVLKAHPDLYEYSLQATMNGLRDVAQSFGNKTSISFEQLRERMDEYKLMIYSSVQVMEKHDYWEIIKKDELLYEEAMDNSTEWNTEDEIHNLHHYAVDQCEPHPFLEWYEIGYPAKLSNKLLEDEGWEIVNVIRGGKLKQNALLSDAAIIEELKGSTGTNKIKYHKHFDSNNISSIKQLSIDTEKCLVDNVIWLARIRSALSDMDRIRKDHEFKGEIQIFNPSNTLLSIYNTISFVVSEDEMRWIPQYEMTIEGNDIRRLYFGCLVYKDRTINLQQVLDSVYEGYASQLVLSRTWGGYQEDDIDISSIYGLEYSNFMIQTSELGHKYFKFDGYRYKNCQPIEPYDGIIQFLNMKSEFVQEVVNFFDDHTLTPGVFQF
jgi:hypothetical protein